MIPFFQFRNSAYGTVSMPASNSGISKPWDNPLRCFYFDHGDDILSHPHDTIFDLSNKSATFSMYFKGTEAPSLKVLFTKGGYGTGGWYIQVNGSALQVVHNTAQVYSAPWGVLNNGSWHLLTIVKQYDGAWDMYVDGVKLVPTIHASGNPTQALPFPFTLGDDTIYSIPGKACELMWFSGVVLSEESINVLVAKSWNQELQDSLTAAWKFDESSGLIATDAVSSYDMTIANVTSTFYNIDSPYL
jgi:hypothetical protein